MLTEFILYLEEQIGEPYMWGGQHTKLTPYNYIEVITKHEKNEENRENAIAYCKAKFDAGADVLYAYDCSGLGMYWLMLKGIYKSDMAANSMMKQCEIVTEPKKGYWLFRLNDGRATHIGYMVSDTYVIHAAGRKLGVIKVPYKKNDSELEYAERIKGIYKRKNLYIKSDTESDVVFVRKRYFEWKTE